MTPLLPVGFTSIYYAKWIGEMKVLSSGPSLQGSACNGYRPLTSLLLQPDFFCSYACFAPVSHISVSAVCLYPCFLTSSLSQMLPFPTASLFRTLHHHLPFPGSWCLLCARSSSLLPPVSGLFAQPALICFVYVSHAQY